MLFEITERQEQKIKEWERQHIFDEHFEFSNDEAIAIETDSYQFTYLIYPSKKNPQKFTGIVRCNYCNKTYQFVSKKHNDIDR